MTSQPSSEHDQATILATHHQLLASFARADATGVAAFYTPGGQLLPPYSTAIRGQAAIQAFWQGCLDMGIGLLQRKPSEVDLLPETANELGTYRLYGRNGKLIDVGNYVVIWKQQAEHWKIHRDIWTSSLPA
jgi:ketosteroid isomerase-like protein